MMGCEKDESPDQPVESSLDKEKRVQSIHFDDLPEGLQSSLSLAYLQKGNTKTGSTPNINKKTPGYRIKAKNNTYYTFSILGFLPQSKTTKENSGFYFDNIVFTQDSLGTDDEYFLRYRPTEDWLMNNRNFKEFSGAIEFYDEVADYLGSLTFNNGETQNNNLGQNRTSSPNTRQNDELDCTIYFVSYICTGGYLGDGNYDYDEEDCTYTYEINCESTPVGGPNDDNDGSGNPTDPNNNNGDDPHGTSGNSGDGETGDDGDIETEPVFVEGEILDCINIGVPGDETTLEIDSFIETGLSSIDLALINDFLKANQCSESAQWCAIQVFESGNIFELEDCDGYEPFDPCAELKEQIEEESYNDKFKDLNSKTGEQKEAGYVQNTDGTFTKLDPINGGHSLDLDGLSYANLNGFIHTHLDDFPTGKIDNITGLPEINEIYRIFSPADVIAFLNIAKNSNNLADVYATVLSSTGDYTICFTGNVNEIPVLKTAKEYRADYIAKLKRYGNERSFLKFLDEIMNVDGIELYKIKKPLFNSTYKIKSKSLDENGKIDSQDCE